MKKLLLLALFCSSMNMFGMQKGAKVPRTRRSMKWHLSKYAVQQQGDILGMQWVREKCEFHCNQGFQTLMRAREALEILNINLSLYKGQTENCGMNLRHVFKIARFKNKIHRLQEQLAKEQKYMERFRNQNNEMLGRLLARKSAAQKKN